MKKKGVTMQSVIISLIIALAVATVLIIAYMYFNDTLYAAADKFLRIFRG